jgi:hypothetical protein
VTLNGDVIADNAGPGIYLQNAGSDLTVTNATIWHNDNTNLVGEILIGDTSTVSLDSTIVGDDGVGAAAGTPTCTAVFSRGPAVSDACNGQFATNAAPSFVNAATRDFHLTPSGNASLIDLGNPAEPTLGLDLDGEPRAVDGIPDGNCAARRDIGADEVAGLSGDCAVAAAPDVLAPTAPLAPGSNVRRCPKGKKLVTIKKHGKKKKVCRKQRKKHRR